MDVAYDRSRYDFSEDTWQAIFAYESKLRSHKVFKKVNFKKGELDSYIFWVKNIISSPEFKKVILNETGFRNSANYYSKDEELMEKQLSNVFYIRHKLERALTRNKYKVEKISKFGIRFSFIDVREFLIILKDANDNDCLEEFLSIPDVWYIIRNIRKNWKLVVLKITM